MDVFSVTKLRLSDKLKELRKPKAEIDTFTDGRVQFERLLNAIAISGAGQAKGCANLVSF
jgi:hypothetical protein